MTLFRNSTHRDVWKSRWCETCFEPHEAMRRIQGKQEVCPIWAKAMREDRKPPQWDRMPRADEMEKSIKCNEYTSRPPRNIRVFNKDYEEIAMFDLDDLPQDISFVPVDNWPDRPTKDGVDHA